MDMPVDEMRSRFGSARVARLATVRPDGGPHLVPATFVVSADVVAFAVDAKPKSTRNLQRLRNLEHDQRVSLLVDAYAEDWSRLWWVRADGVGRVLAPADARPWVAKLQAKYAQYQAAPPEGPVVEIVVHRWAGWRASHRA